MYEAGQVIQILEEEGLIPGWQIKVGAAKDMGPAIGVAINGINIQVKTCIFVSNSPWSSSLNHQGPNDAGDVSIDEGGFQLACGGHVTPPTTNLVLLIW